MSIFSEAAHSADLRDVERIKIAQRGKGVNEGLLRRQQNKQFHDRLVRACLLDVKRDHEITTALRAAVVACPELLLERAYALGWGESRHQRDAAGGPPPLFAEYHAEFQKEKTSFIGSDAIGTDIGPKAVIRTVLLCHGLSPTPDTILLLADIGRAARVSHALRLTDIHVLLADVSWSRFNRSASKYFKSERDYLNGLRVTQDKRLRLYNALQLKCDVFSISAYQASSKSISELRLREASALHRELAAALWGKRALEPHTIQTKALIGQSFNGINAPNQSLLPDAIRTLVRFDQCASAIEESLSGELIILRSLSEGFSSFDEETFIYYFAQFYAQDEYEEFLKIGVISETKFDGYFDKNYEHFKRFAEQDTLPRKASMPSSRGNVRRPTARRYVYFPQYNLGGLQVLPYSSLSLDVIRDEGTFGDASARLIFLENCGERKRLKHMTQIANVLNLTSIAARNRLMSDLLSFVHLLVIRAKAEGLPGSPLNEAIRKMGQEIAEDILSKETMEDYPDIFSDWLTAIDRENSILPFHMVPYTWDEEKWESEMMEKSTNLIFELLMSIRRVCE